MKKCSKCFLIKPLTDYHKNYDRLRNECKTCGNSRRKEWHNSNTNRWRDYVYKDTYGINIEEYNRMEALQKGLCAICGKKEETIRNKKIINLSVDHDHVDGKIRGLLCCNCNNGLGRFKDCIDTLKEAVIYLEKHK